MKNLIKNIKFKSFVYIVAVVYLCINLISAQFDLMTKRQEYESVQAQKDRLVLQVDDTKRLMDESASDEYIEHIARERLGYAYPGETVYTDIHAQ